METPDFSIIVPVYNPGKLLERTILSVLNQTETSWELLLQDDGSTDGSIEIMQKYAARDPRVRYCPFLGNKEDNVRRRQIKHARGKYLFFFDHDDCMHPRLLEYGRWALEVRGCDFLNFAHRTVHTGAMPDFEPLPDFEKIPCKVPENRYKYLQPIDGWCIQSTFWSYLTLTEYVRNVRLEHTLEQPTVLELLRQAKRPLISRAELIYYSDFNASISRSPVKMWYVKDTCEALRYCCELFDYGRSGNMTDWIYVRTASIIRNLKYLLRWLQGSESKMKPEDYAECARYLANELKHFRDMNCLGLRACGSLNRYFRFRRFIRRWSGN